MIFKQIGLLATRFRILIIALWVAAAAIVTLQAPSIEDVASSDQSDFLPSDAPFKHAEAVYRETFPNRFSPGSTLIVIDARDSAEGILQTDESLPFSEQLDTEAGRFIADLSGWLSYGAALNSVNTLDAWLAADSAPYTLDAMQSWYLEEDQSENTEALAEWMSLDGRVALAVMVQGWLASDADPDDATALAAWANSADPATNVAALEAWLNSDQRASNVHALQTWLEGQGAPDNVLRVISPSDSAASAQLMIAGEDADDPALANQVAIAHVDLSTTSPEERTMEALRTIDEWMDEHRPATLTTYQTGEAPVVSNTTDSIKTSVDRTIWVTVVLVIIMLLAVYRSPVSPLIPLAAVTVAYLITRGIVAYLGD
ncbi:MAG: MMPL family transporter, partial [Chloroflexi bacterium]|nr:MMPL family transporter [Chloroflexota bacterium]